MARSPIWKEMSTPVNGHEGQELILQNLLVMFTIHGDIPWKEQDPHVPQLQKNRPRPSHKQGV
jgi:hypothetical protein